MNEESLINILKHYQNSFKNKEYDIDNNDHDVLMDVFWLSPETKRQNRQYRWRELGMCRQLLVTEVARNKCPTEFKPAQKIGKDEPIDLIIWKDAIDTKYRIWSWDSWTLKKFKTYWNMIEKMWLNPVILILREDNLPAAITALNVWNRDVYIWDACFAYIKNKTWYDIKEFLEWLKNKFSIIN